MVRLNAAQEGILSELTSEKTTYDKGNADFEAWVAAQRDMRKTRIRELVAAATGAGIPNRRIYMALGFDQVGPFNNFVRPPLSYMVGPADWHPTEPVVQAAISQETGGFEPTFTADSEMP